MSSDFKLKFNDQIILITNFELLKVTNAVAIYPWPATSQLESTPLQAQAAARRDRPPRSAR